MESEGSLSCSQLIMYESNFFNWNNSPFQEAVFSVSRALNTGLNTSSRCWPVNTCVNQAVSSRARITTMECRRQPNWLGQCICRLTSYSSLFAPVPLFEWARSLLLFGKKQGLFLLCHNLSCRKDSDNGDWITTRWEVPGTFLRPFRARTNSQEDVGSLSAK
jgi:hypothetical protein